eukprot:2395731-Amphidinium_carterae.1
MIHATSAVCQAKVQVLLFTISGECNSRHRKPSAGARCVGAVHQLTVCSCHSMLLAEASLIQIDSQESLSGMLYDGFIMVKTQRVQHCQRTRCSLHLLLPSTPADCASRFQCPPTHRVKSNRTSAERPKLRIQCQLKWSFRNDFNKQKPCEEGIRYGSIDGTDTARQYLSWCNTALVSCKMHVT